VKGSLACTILDGAGGRLDEVNVAACPEAAFGLRQKNGSGNAEAASE
jgi:hypothetical protein